MGIKADNVPSCPKYTLFAFNLIVLIGGLIMTIVGIVALADDDYFAGREFLEPKMFRAGAILVITVGIFIIIFSFLGCCGAIKESSCLLMTYAVLTSLALIGVGTVAILGFVFKENVVELMDDKLRDFMNRYEPDNPNDPETYAWDKLQSIGRCCGINGPKDWIDHGFSGQLPPGEIPWSCCSNRDKACTPTNKNVYTAGCMAIVHKLEGYAGTLAIVALVFAILMIVGVIFACIVGCAV